MTSTIVALQNLYVAMGGNLTDTYETIDGGAAVGNLVRIPDMINAIAQLKASQSGELPTVTADDNGKVLKVIDGAWGVGSDNVE